MYCRYCAAENPDEALYCRSCGKRIAGGATDDGWAQHRTTNWRDVTVGVVADLVDVRRRWTAPSDRFAERGPEPTQAPDTSKSRYLRLLRPLVPGLGLVLGRRRDG